MVTLSTVVVAVVAVMTLAQFVTLVALLYLAAKAGMVGMATTLLQPKMARFPAVGAVGLVASSDLLLLWAVPAAGGDLTCSRVSERRTLRLAAPRGMTGGSEASAGVRRPMFPA